MSDGDANASTPIISFGDDGSPGADVAWSWITAQHWPGWTVDVVRVTAPKPGIESLFAYDPLREVHPDDARVASAASGIAGVRHLTTAFDPRIVLNGKRDGRLMVVGARGRGLLKAMRLGSTAEWLMRCPGTPLVVARSAAPVQRVLVCVDGSTHADAVVRALSDLPWIGGREVTVLSVIDDATATDEPARDAARVLEAAGAATHLVVVGTEGAGGRHATRAILDRVDALAPDLVAMGTRGMTGLRRLTTGSVAGAVSHAASCTVLLARDEVEPGDAGSSPIG